MLTASIKGGVFTYCYRLGKTKVTIRAPKDAIFSPSLTWRAKQKKPLIKER